MRVVREHEWRYAQSSNLAEIESFDGATFEKGLLEPAHFGSEDAMASGDDDMQALR